MGKTASAKRPRAPKRAVRWQDVLAAVQDDQTRSCLVSQIKDAGFTADDFATLKLPREIVAESLVMVEDELEAVRGAKAQIERANIRTVRRRLEVELWP